MISLRDKLLAAAVPCKSWCDCHTRHDPVHCIAAAALQTMRTVDGELLGTFFFGGLDVHLFGKRIDQKGALLVEEVISTGKCKLFKPSPVFCPGCQKVTVPSAVRQCQHCQTAGCADCLPPVHCPGCAKILCAGCIVIDKLGKTVLQKCFSCGANIYMKQA